MSMQALNPAPSNSPETGSSSSESSKSHSLRELKRDSLRALQWDFIGKFGCQLVNLLVTTILARLLTPEHFGQVTIANAIATVATVVCEAGFYSALIQRDRLSRVYYNSAFYSSFVLSLVLAALVCAGSGFIARLYKAPELQGIVVATAVMFVVNALASIQTAYLTKQLRFAPISQGRIASAVLSGIVAVVMAEKGYGVWALMMQMILQTVVFAVYITWVCEWKVGWEFSWSAVRDLWGFGSKMFLSGVIDTVYRRMDLFMIGKAFSTVQLGYFQRARVLESLIAEYGAGSLGRVLFPAFSTLQGDRALLAHSFQKVYTPLAWLVFGVSAVGYVCAEDMVRVLFSEKWLHSVDFLRLMLLGTYVYPLSAPLGAVIQATGNSSSFLRAEILKKTIFGLNLCMLLIWDIDAYLAGLAIAAFLAFLINLYFAAKSLELKTRRILRELFPLFCIASAAAWITLQSIQRIPVHLPLLRGLVSAALAAGLYCAITAVLGLRGFHEARDLIARSGRRIWHRLRPRPASASDVS